MVEINNQIPITPPQSAPTPTAPVSPLTMDENKKERRKQKFLAIGVITLALIILIGLIYWLWLAPAPELNTQVPEQTQTETQLPATQTVVTQAVVPVKPATTEEELQRLAASFVERFGTYSNQAGYSNLRDLRLFMSGAFKIWADDFTLQATRAGVDNSIYYGLTTKSVVVSTDVFNETAGSAVFLIQAQRQEAIGAASNVRSFQQDAEVKMIKEGGVWKVDKVTWQESEK